MYVKGSHETCANVDPKAEAAALRSIAENVRHARLNIGLTQEQLAERAHLETRTIQYLEAGRANPTVSVLLAIAEVLNVLPGSLFAPAPLTTRPVGRPRKPRTKT